MIKRWARIGQTAGALPSPPLYSPAPSPPPLPSHTHLVTLPANGHNNAERLNHLELTEAPLLNEGKDLQPGEKQSAWSTQRHTTLTPVRPRPLKTPEPPLHPPTPYPTQPHPLTLPSPVRSSRLRSCFVPTMRFEPQKEPLSTSELNLFLNLRMAGAVGSMPAVGFTT